MWFPPPLTPPRKGEGNPLEPYRANPPQSKRRRFEARSVLEARTDPRTRQAHSGANVELEAA